MDVLLPEAAINCLPLSAEPLSSWQKEVDILRFTTAIYVYFPEFGFYLYQQGKKKMQTWSNRFLRGIKETASEKERTSQVMAVPDFRQDALFGRAAKYVVAWNTSVQSLLEEGAFYSIAHILESEEEIDCSLLLASQLYYKQAVQVLRSFLEELILPIHFCENADEFSQWKANHYRIPPLRGRDGLLQRLVDRGVLPGQIALATSDLYRDLNGYIHGSENRFIHKNAHLGSRSGLSFKEEDFHEWCGYLSRSIELGIRLLRINYLQWEQIRTSKWANLRSQGKVLCSVCHNEEDFDVEFISAEGTRSLAFSPDGVVIEIDSPASGFIMYHCRRCGSQTTVTAENKPEL